LKRSWQKDIKNLAKRLNAATAGGLLGVITGKVKFRDEMVSIAAAVLIGGAIFRRGGIVSGLAVAIAIVVGCGLLIYFRKWRVGVPRSSSDY
jgi:hypothetical protein